MSSKAKTNGDKRSSNGPSASGKEPPRAEPDRSPKESLPPAHPIKALEDERARLRNEVKEYQEKFLRARADYENYVRRSTKEAREFVQTFKAGLLLRLIDALEDLEKSVQHLKETGADAKGVTLVAEQIRKILRDEGVRPIETKDVPFNYRYHTAVESTPTSERPDGAIIDVVRRGYLVDDQILRPAMVRVAVAPKTPQPVESTTEKK